MKTTLIKFLFVLLVLPGVADALTCYACVASSIDDVYTGSEDCWMDMQLTVAVQPSECDTTCRLRRYTANYTDSSGIVKQSMQLDRACQMEFGPVEFSLGCGDQAIIQGQLPLEDFNQHLMTKDHPPRIGNFLIVSFEECHCNVDSCNTNAFDYGIATLPTTTRRPVEAGRTYRVGSTRSPNGDSTTTTRAVERALPIAAASSADDDDSALNVVIGLLVVCILLLIGAGLFIRSERRKRKKAEANNPMGGQNTLAPSASRTSGQSVMSAQSGQSAASSISTASKPSSKSIKK